MSDKSKKFKLSPFGVFRLILLAVVLGCSVYVIWWCLVSYSTKKCDRDVAVRYTYTVEYKEESTSSTANSEAEPEIKYEQYVDFDSLMQKGQDVAAWIKIPCLEVIDYPVVWRDDFYYLKRDWTGAESRRGSIFIEEKNRPDLLDLHTIIYGHNMRDDTMFGPLEKYDSEEFYRENGGTVIIYTPKAVYTYEIFSVEHCSNDDENVYTIGFIKDEVFGRFVKGMKERSLYDTGVCVSENDRVLTLSTCTYDYYGSRFVVHAKLTDEKPVM